MQNLQTVDWSRLPVPADDGGADHLEGAIVPSIALPSTKGSPVDLASVAGRTILFAYPMTGRPDRSLPDGWDDIPGARGCTPQACAFRDAADQLRADGYANVFGISSQTSEDQREASDRLHLPYPLLSDADLGFANAMRLPTMTVDRLVLLKRLTMVIEDGRALKVFYPVFPPDQAVAEVLAWTDRPT